MEDRPRWVNVTKIHERAQQSALCPRDIVIALIALTDTGRTPVCTNAADCDALVGWEFVADKLGDEKFPIFVSRSRLTRPPFRIDGDCIECCCSRRWIQPRSRWFARNIQNRLIVRGAIFCKRGQASTKNILPTICFRILSGILASRLRHRWGCMCRNMNRCVLRKLFAMIKRQPVLQAHLMQQICSRNVAVIIMRLFRKRRNA